MLLGDQQSALLEIRKNSLVWFVLVYILINFDYDKFTKKKWYKIVLFGRTQGFRDIVPKIIFFKWCSLLHLYHSYSFQSLYPIINSSKNVLSLKFPQILHFLENSYIDHLLEASEDCFGPLPPPHIIKKDMTHFLIKFF